jgi:hypothetical protein
MKATFKPSLMVALSFAALTGCGATVADRPCPRVTEFPPALQRQAAEELAAMQPGSAVAQMMDAMAADRAYNRAVCKLTMHGERGGHAW